MSELISIDAQPTVSMDEEATGYELITSEEVDRVVAAVEELMTRVQSENIRTILDETADEIYALIYSGEAEGEGVEEAEAA